jgi:hypothetical protein
MQDMRGEGAGHLKMQSVKNAKSQSCETGKRHRTLKDTELDSTADNLAVTLSSVCKSIIGKECVLEMSLCF